MSNDLQLDVAEGFALLGMRQEAVEVLKMTSLSPLEKTLFECLFGFLTITAITEAAGEALAGQVTAGDDLEKRQNAGQFWLRRAQTLCSEKEPHEARRALSKMVRIWPEGWKMAVKSTDLEAIW